MLHKFILHLCMLRVHKKLVSQQAQKKSPAIIKSSQLKLFN